MIKTIYRLQVIYRVIKANDSARFVNMSCIVTQIALQLIKRRQIMAKGTDSKNIIFTKLMEVFPDAFWEDAGKILRVPFNEDGSRVEIKVTLTAAKNNLGGEAVSSAFDNTPIVNNTPSVTTSSIEPTQEEKDNVAKLIASLGL